MKTPFLNHLTALIMVLLLATTTFAQEGSKSKDVKIKIIKNGDTTIIDRENGELSAEDLAKLEKLKADGKKHKEMAIVLSKNAKKMADSLVKEFRVIAAMPDVKNLKLLTDSVLEVIIHRKADGPVEWKWKDKEFRIVKPDSNFKMLPAMPLMRMNGKEFQFKDGKLYIDGKEITADKELKGKIILSPDVNTTEEAVYIFKRDGKEKKIVIRMLPATESDLKKANKEALAPARILEAEKLRIYPNPSAGKFNLEFTLQERGDTQVEVLDINGKVIFSDKLKGFTGSYKKEIDLPETAGVYLINITQNGNKIVKKIIKE